jgi:hypothetical protein
MWRREETITGLVDSAYSSRACKHTASLMSISRAQHPVHLLAPLTLPSSTTSLCIDSQTYPLPPKSNTRHTNKNRPLTILLPNYIVPGISWYKHVHKRHAIDMTNNFLRQPIHRSISLSIKSSTRLFTLCKLYLVPPNRRMQPHISIIHESAVIKPHCLLRRVECAP